MSPGMHQGKQHNLKPDIVAYIGERNETALLPLVRANTPGAFFPRPIIYV